MTEKQHWPDPVYLTKDHAINITLRDYFAAKAMQGLMSRKEQGGFDFAVYEKDAMRVALWAYDLADEMLKARES